MKKAIKKYLPRIGFSLAITAILATICVKGMQCYQRYAIKKWQQRLKEIGRSQRDATDPERNLESVIEFVDDNTPDGRMYILKPSIDREIESVWEKEDSGLIVGE